MSQKKKASLFIQPLGPYLPTSDSRQDSLLYQAVYGIKVEISYHIKRITQISPYIAQVYKPNRKSILKKFGLVIHLLS